MRIWVSGAAGKLGAEVCRQLLVAGHQVVPVDVRPGGVVEVDLGDRVGVGRSLAGCDAIVHCAAIASPENVVPAELVHNNVMSTFNALEEAWGQGIRTAVLASSGSIYGTAWAPEELTVAEVPVDESTPLAYVDPYALTKDILERTGAMYARRGMQVTALRLHWILTAAEVREYVADAPPAANRRNLWGYVDLGEAARACVLALAPRPEAQRFEALVIAAEDTGRHEPTADLLARWSPDTRATEVLDGHAALFSSRRAGEVLGWKHRSTWRQ